ncbi:hypothetical protein [[Limnothrix rosea] IAM M-220]|uniref:hypothetical protein n=1 Tax=[Limnothrix rosea] IAM M-220 TaxID=454133 RepID=UPI0009648899|nr:hypothetical protein [[Limnothrix rosea] IAM M-220]OKH19191.1 hypothetical protein NIES208_02770 [[Limnothrix rosea] IAM M-220]
MELFLERPYREVAIADFGNIVLAIPTDKLIQPHAANPFDRIYPQRVYSHNGWFFYREKWLGLLHNLSFTAKSVSAAEHNPLRFPARLEYGFTVSFEVNSWRTLPEAIAEQAILTYRFEDEKNSYYSLFRDLKPQFVRIYPFKSLQQFSKQIRWLLEEEYQANRR